jgi:hypothetical protein
MIRRKGGTKNQEGEGKGHENGKEIKRALSMAGALVVYLGLKRYIYIYIYIYKVCVCVCGVCMHACVYVYTYVSYIFS